jgi:hypothetical protein
MSFSELFLWVLSQTCDVHFGKTLGLNQTSNLRSTVLLKLISGDFILLRFAVFKIILILFKVTSQVQLSCVVAYLLNQGIVTNYPFLVCTNFGLVITWFHVDFDLFWMTIQIRVDLIRHF